MNMYTDENPGMSEYYQNHPRARKDNRGYGNSKFLRRWTTIFAVVWLGLVILTIIREVVRG